MSFDIVSFDLDGTLVDTAAEIAEAANRALASHGIARRPISEIVDLIGQGTRTLITALYARAVEADAALPDRVRLDELLDSMDRHYAETTGTMAAAYEGAHEALERLRGAGVTLACVTNKEFRHARRVLEVTALDQYFALTVGGDTLPEKKPHPSVLHHVVRALGGEARRMAHVGDSRTDVEAARNAGVAAWAVPYGYNAGVPIGDAQPHRIFPGLSAVADHVLAGRLAERG